MLFKPWSEFERAPRHALDEANYDDETSLKPTIQLPDVFITKENAFEVSRSFPLIIVPYNLQFLIDSVPIKTATIATVTATQQALAETNPQTSEFLEDENLYTATLPEDSLKRYEVKVLTFEPLSINAIVVPNLTNAHPILQHQLSRFVLKTLDPELLVLLSPCTLNYSESVCKLVHMTGQKHAQFTAFANVNPLKPPHFILGITAAMMSAAVFAQVDTVNLVLDSEGTLNFERINNDSVLAAAKILSEFLGLSSSLYIEFKNSVLKRSNLNDYVTSGMYI